MNKERPILFSTPMIQAILAGNKFMTRRIIKTTANNILWNTIIVNRHGGWTDDHGYPIKCPFGIIGDILWVRETFGEDIETGKIFYKADNSEINAGLFTEKWKPSIFMPRSASRITLQITDLRVEFLQDISEADAISEGCNATCPDGTEDCRNWSARNDFQSLWKKINGNDSWNENPFVWVIKFNRLTALDNLNDMRVIWSNVKK